MHIPIGNEDTGFGLSLFPPIASKKICNRVGYYASFSMQWTKKSNRQKTSIFTSNGCRLFLLLLVLMLSSSGLYAKDNTLIGLKVQPMPNHRLRMDFQFTDPIKQSPASFITEKPRRLVLDFVDSLNQLNSESQAKTIKLNSVDKYRIVSVKNRIRAIIELSTAISYSGSTTGNVYTLMINGIGDELIPKPEKLFVTHRNIYARYNISNIDFKGIDRQGGRLIVDVSNSGIPVDVTQKGNEIVANFLSTKIPPRLMKRFDVTDFHSPTQFFKVQQKRKNVLITLINKGDFGYFAYQVNKQFMIDVFPLSADEIQKAKLKKKVFTGKLISLDFQDIKVSAVLQILADFTGVNIVVSDNVKQSITLRLNNVPWDQAMDIILTTQGLDKRQVGNVILVDTSAQFISRENGALKELEAAKKLEPIRSDLLQINYAKATEIATMLKDKNNSLLSKRGALSVDVRTNTIWLQDTGTQIEEIRELVKKLDVPVKQVSIEARIVNVTKDCELDLGVRWGVSKPSHLSGTLEGANQFAAGTSPPAILPIAERLNLDLIAVPAAGPPATVAVALAKLGSGVLLDLELSALESEGRAEIIASPRLLTTNQQPATIESGEDIPYQQSTSSGATAVAFKKAVLSLKVTPQITPDGKLLMDLVINQDSNSGQSVQGVPIILTKSIQTNVLVSNGQTIVLGGIYQQSKTSNIVRVPFLGRLPVVGNLFRNSHIVSSNDELLIFITPRIIASSLSITTVDGKRQCGPGGQGQCISRNVGLDKFGKQVRRPVDFVK